ncbi:MAG: co-chaperone GroES [Candidatus Saccharibacteria bacterium]|nr:co-chaperone GroES [Candidatus Saccharibacteria bacterium]MCY4088850.1 co-chaperone GroES [Candidatus Saccharibacteria bacterium]
MNKVSIKPLDKLVLATIDVAPTTTASGLYLPENATEKPKTATVVAIGTNVKNIKVGETIIYESYSGTDIKHQDQDYVLVKEEKILATIN